MHAHLLFLVASIVVPAFSAPLPVSKNSPVVYNAAKSLILIAAGLVQGQHSFATSR
jgi:hypothetical protein